MTPQVATAQDLTDPADRRLFRFLEMLPGLVSWLTIFLAILLSWQRPFLVAVFILAFDLYWLFRALYFSFHLHAGFRKMEEYKKIDWFSRVKQINDWQKIYHLCLFTLCDEPWEIVQESFRSLEKSDYPREKMIVVLSAEERTGQEILDKVQEKFSQSFFKLLITRHPFGRPGEIPGKGSNDRWAEIRAKKEIIDPLKIPHQNVIASFFDVDSVVFPKHFSCLTWHYLTCLKPERTSFQPIPLFINNIWEAPFISRTAALASTFWNTLSQERPEKLITFSSHAMSFKTLVEVGFKQANVVSDDSRIFWQSFLHFNGDYQTQSLYYPMAMDANAVPSFWRTLKNIYKQQRRWAYGCDEIPYVFFHFFKDKKISLFKKLSCALFLFEAHWSWATNSLLIFLLGWLPLILGGPNFSQQLLAYNLPNITSRLMTLAMIGLLASIYLGFKLMPTRPLETKKTGLPFFLVFIIEWLVLPLTMFFFWTLPGLDAQTRLVLGRYLGFWHTEKHRKSQ
jgi:hypothetical protein